MASDGLNLQPGSSILDQAEKMLAEQEKNTAHAGVVVQGDKIGAEAGIERELGRGWSWGAMVRWWKGEKVPTVAGEVKKRW